MAPRAATAVAAAATLLLAAALPAVLAAGAPAATLPQCIWRGAVCDASPAFILSRAAPVAPADNELAIASLKAAATEAACHVFSTQQDCVRGGGCVWDLEQVSRRFASH